MHGTVRATHSKLFGVSLLLFPVACGGSSPNANDNTTGVETSTGGTETGDDPIDLGPCEALIKCVNEFDPVAAEGVEMNYGPNGVCYTIPGQTIETCWQDCQDALDGWAMLHPSIPWCNGAECVSDADCDDPQAASCSLNNECGPPCGNGRLDADELCDPGVAEACTSACLFENHDCSPIDHAGCAEGEKCAYDYGPDQIQLYFGCFPGITGPGALQETCSGLMDCSLEASYCTFDVQGCSDLCCAPYCYLGESELAKASCPGGLSCVPLSESVPGGGFLPGAELFGICS